MEGRDLVEISRSLRMCPEGLYLLLDPSCHISLCFLCIMLATLHAIPTTKD